MERLERFWGEITQQKTPDGRIILEVRNYQTLAPGSNPVTDRSPQQEVQVETSSADHFEPSDSPPHNPFETASPEPHGVSKRCRAKGFKGKRKLARLETAPSDNEEGVKCDLCEVTVEDRLELRDHYRMDHKFKHFCKVPKCGAMFKIEAALPKHLARYHGSDFRYVRCSSCFYWTYNERLFVRHHPQHQSRRLTCNLCDMSFLNILEHNEHFEEFHGKYISAGDRQALVAHRDTAAVSDNDHNDNPAPVEPLPSPARQSSRIKIRTAKVATATDTSKASAKRDLLEELGMSDALIQIQNVHTMSSPEQTGHPAASVENVLPDELRNVVAVVVGQNTKIEVQSDNEIDEADSESDAGRNPLDQEVSSKDQDLNRSNVTGHFMTPSDNADEQRQRLLKKRSKFHAANLALREAGLAYCGVKKTRNGEITEVVTKEARKLMPPCPFNGRCRSTKAFTCSTLTLEHRQQIFTKFWKLTWDAKKQLVKSWIEAVPPKRVTGQFVKKREHTFKYFLITEDGTKLRVCNTMFCNTIGLSSSTISQWIGSTKRTKPRSSTKPGESKKEKFLDRKHNLTAFLLSFAQFGEPVPVGQRWKSIRDIYMHYKKTIDSPLSKPSFYGTISELGLTLENLFKFQ